MIIRTLLFFLVMYLLIKVIGRLFLPSGSNKRKSKASIFYRTFQQFNQQYQNQQNQQNQQNRQSSSNNQQFEEIEEAEYEDITDDEKTSTKSSD